MTSPFKFAGSSTVRSPLASAPCTCSSIAAWSTAAFVSVGLLFGVALGVSVRYIFIFVLFPLTKRHYKGIVTLDGVAVDPRSTERLRASVGRT